MKKASIFLLMFLTTVTNFADAAYQFSPQKSEITFSFKSTLHGVEGRVEEFVGDFRFLKDEMIGGEVTIKVSEMTTFHKKRDENMYEMFQADSYPYITYQFEQLKSYNESQIIQNVCVGKLKIRDISNEVKFPINWTKTGDLIVGKGEVVLSLEAFNLEPPSFMKIIHVFDPVKVEFALIFEEK